MNTRIFLLTDYNDRFGSKWKDSPYRSGLDKTNLISLFRNYGYEIIIKPFSSINQENINWVNEIVIYTSSEENGLHYKTYIQDIILALEMAGAIVLPSYKMLHSNNNKVFMELLRRFHIPDNFQTINARTYGTYEELKRDIENGIIDYPVVIKSSEGAMSRGVFLARTRKELIENSRRISKSSNIKAQIKESFRKFKYPGYRKESSHQKKFIVQTYIPNLNNDWKVLIYGNKYFILRRGVKKNDFRASGSGLDYKTGTRSEFPLQMLDLLRNFFLALNVPNLSLDFCFDGINGYILEFQGIHFGTATQFWSDDYYEYEDNRWKISSSKFSQEEVYVDSIVEFINARIV